MQNQPQKSTAIFIRTSQSHAMRAIFATDLAQQLEWLNIVHCRIWYRCGPSVWFLSAKQTGTLFIVVRLQQIDGTVNRILLKLQAGPNELCDNIRFQVKCSSMLLSVDGNTAHLNADASDDHEENAGSDSHQLRTPVLVSWGETVTDRIDVDGG